MNAITDRLGVVAAALSDDPRQAPRMARQQGFRGLLFEAYSIALNIPDLSATGRREFRRLLASHDQQLIGLRVDLGAKGLGPGADLERRIQQLDRAMEAARGLDAPRVCVDLGPLPAPPPASKPRPAVAPEQAGQIIIPTTFAPPAPTAPLPAPPDPVFVSLVQAALVEIGSRADRYSVTIALSSSLAGFASLHEALLTARCQWFGVDLDPVAILRDEWPRDEVFSALGPLVRHVRARDAAAGPDKRTKPMVIGRGDTKWSELLGLLDEAGYRGLLTLDPMELPDRAAAAGAGAKFLRLLG